MSIVDDRQVCDASVQANDSFQKSIKNSGMGACDRGRPKFSLAVTLPSGTASAGKSSLEISELAKLPRLIEFREWQSLRTRD